MPARWYYPFLILRDLIMNEIDYVEHAFKTIVRFMGLVDFEDDIVLTYSGEGWQLANYDDSVCHTTTSITDLFPFVNIESSDTVNISIANKFCEVVLDYYSNDYKRPLTHFNKDAIEFFKYNFRISYD